jgi:hypothetical protein
MSADIGRATSPDADGKFFRGLVERIRAGGCVLLMGPGVAVDASSPERLPVTTLLARRLAEDPELQARCSPEMAGNLRYVAQLHYEVKRDLEDLAIVISDFYQGLKGTTTAFHRNLAQLPFRLCINTSADDFMLEAFRATGTKRPAAAHFNFRRPLESLLRQATETEPLVYYLYGRSDDLYSLVLTESDLIEFLVAMVRGDPALPDYVRGRLGDPDTTFLFVGFGFQNWYLRVLLHVLKIYGHKSRAVALEDVSFFSHPDRPQTVGFFSGDRSIEFRPLQWDTFADQLCAAYHATVPLGLVRPGVEPGPDAPKAFLCYASEDREAVEALGEALEARGIAIWRDKQSLRTGENWDRVLVEVIRKRVDYVVVAQSSLMATRVEGYFRKEIEVALDRLSKFSRDFVFVLPVTLSGGSPLPELEALHTIDVATGPGVDRLANVIRDDWAKPNRRPVAASKQP